MLKIFLKIHAKKTNKFNHNRLTGIQTLRQDYQL